MGTPSLSLPVSPEVARALWDQVAWVSRRAKERRGLVYFPPTIGWDIPSFQRPHHLARAFTIEGFAVVFDCRNARDPVFGFKEIEPDIFLFKGPAELLKELPVTLVWCFVYNVHHRLDVTPKAPLVYDIIDTIEVFPYARSLLAKNHAWALQWADLVTCVSRALQEDFVEQRPDVLYLPNAVETWRFETYGVPMPEDPALQAFRAASGPVAGYCGSLARWFDFDLLGNVAKNLPDWRFLIIGPHLDDSGRQHPALGQPNVFPIGPRPYPSIPFYMELVDVGLLPFRGDEVLRGLSPLKLYEYLAAGKPTVVTPFPEAQGFPGVLTAGSPASFAAALEKAADMARNPEVVAQLRRFAQRESWLARVRTALDHLEPYLAFAGPTRPPVRNAP
ncbi:Putative teichuronic acid biosynthesis glycosyltransferase TuaH [bacterium HR09]|nr:Putative teichuronic acid biosynthesis glycosyltransferase TuaH [bacterium HR09]